MGNDLYYKFIKPDKSLADFVESFWFLHNQSDRNKETIGLPDGRIDLSLFKSATQPFRIRLIGLGTQQYEQGIIPANSLMFVISFKPLAVEYILHTPIADLLNSAKDFRMIFGISMRMT